MKLLGGQWLLEQEFSSQLQERFSKFTVDQGAHELFIQRVSSAVADGTPFFIRDDSTARIPILGVLTTEPDFFLDLFGGGNTVYGDIVAGIQAAEADADISQIVLEIDSPGGSAAGFLAAAQAIAAATKPVTAQVTSMAASAAFGLATQAREIVVLDDMAQVGSVGVVMKIFVSDEIVHLTSTDAPEKRPDVTTDEGRAAIIRQLDDLHAVFAGVIADGRGTDVANVNTNFGRGSLVIAREALRVGMIDGISMALPSASREITATAEESRMDLKELREKHSTLYSEIFDLGVARERERCVALVNTAKEVGSPGLATDFIIDGSCITSPSVAGKFLVASSNASHSQHRVDDNTALTANRTGSDDPKADSDAATNRIFDELEANLEIGLEG